MRRRWPPSPAEVGVIAGLLAFLFTLTIPAAYVAPGAGKRPHRGFARSSKEAAFRRYVQRNWTQEAVLPKAAGLGQATGFAAATAPDPVRVFAPRKRRWRRPLRALDPDLGPDPGSYRGGHCATRAAPRSVPHRTEIG